MRVLLITRATLEHAQKGGMEAHAAQLAVGLTQRGHTVEVLTTAHPTGIVEGSVDGVPHRFLEAAPSGSYSREWFEASADWVVDRHADAPYDVLLSESGSAEGVLAAAADGRISNLPAVCVCHGLAWWTLAGMWRGLGSATTLPGVAKMAARWLYERVGAQLSALHYDRVVCVSEPLVQACSREWHYPPERVCCVPNGVDVERFASARPDPALRGEGLCVLVSGRLEPDKGVHLALGALAEMRSPAHLLIAGDGSARATLERLAATLQLGARARFLGHLPPDRLAACHATSDVYLFPTLLNESFGYGLAEAMAAARPLVAPPIGGIPMLLEESVTGLGFPPDSQAGIAHALDTLAGDPGLRERLGREGQRRARERFTYERMLDGFERVLKEVSDTCRPAPSDPGP